MIEPCAVERSEEQLPNVTHADVTALMRDRPEKQILPECRLCSILHGRAVGLTFDLLNTL